MPKFDAAALDRLRGIAGRRPAIEIDAPQYKRASVLIPLVRMGSSDWGVLFQQRSSELQAHSGQIAFPGGGVELHESLAEASLREAQEEVGIPPDRVELIGRLDDVVTNSGFLVAPFVGVIDRPVEYRIQASEVVEAFEVPLSTLMSPGQPEVRYLSFRNRSHPAYYYSYRQYEIWGLTGRMLKSFLDLVWQSV